MGKVATDVAASASGDDLPAVEELLNAGSFQERLEKARAQREIALALLAENAETDQGFSVRRMPWEVSDPTAKRVPIVFPPVPEIRSEVGATLSLVIAKTLAEPVVPEAKQPDAESDTQATDLEAPTSRRFGVVRLSGGFLLGLAVGGGVMWLIPLLQDAVLTAEGFDRPQVAVSGAEPVNGDPVASQTAGGPLTMAPSAEALRAPMPDAGADAVADSPIVVATTADSIAKAMPPMAVGAASVLSDLPWSAPELLPAALDVAWTAPGLAGGELPAREMLAGGVAGLTPVSLVPSAPAMPPVLRENPDLSLGAQALPSAFTPAEVVSPGTDGAAIGVGDGGRGFDGVNVHVLAATGAAESDLGEVATLIRNAGFQVTDPASVPVTIKKSQVRYYHPEDLKAAGVLADTLGMTARDFTTAASAPPPGTIEVWLAGKKPVAASAAPAKKKKTAKSKAPAPAPAQPPAVSEEQQLLALRDRLLAELRGSGNP